MTALLLTLAAGAAGAFAGYKSKIPAGCLIGALLATAALSLLTGRAQAPPAYKIAAQAIAGMFIGAQLAAIDLKALRAVWKGALLVMAGMLAINLAAGFAMRAVSDMELKTALFAATPGGIAEISIISGEQGANTFQVSLLQFARMLFALLVFPAAAQKLIMAVRRRAPEPPPRAVAADGVRATPRNTLIVSVAGALTGYLGYASGVSGMMLVFPMLAVAALGRAGIHARLKPAVKRVAQALSGIAIGCTVTLGDVSGLGGLLAPLAALLLIYLVLCLALGFLLYKVGGLPSEAAFFSCIPAGVSDMALLASDYGAGGPIVALMQLVRYAGVVVLAPVLIPLIAG